MFDTFTLKIVSERLKCDFDVIMLMSRKKFHVNSNIFDIRQNKSL